MQETPKISVIMSVYNGESYLAQAVDSVLRQTFSDWELIIINDCSSDSTASILKEYAERDARVHVLTNEVNSKLPASLNRGIAASRGTYIARMDADDICLPDRLEKQYRFMEEHPDVAISSCRFLTLKNGAYASGGCGGRCDADAIKAMLFVSNPILHPGVIARAQVMRELLYDTALTCTEDLALWIKAAQKGLKMEILPEYLMIYRLHDKQITSTTRERQHKEVLALQNGYYTSLLSPMDETTQKFYISGIYFKEAANIALYRKFVRFITRANREKKAVSSTALHYALFEILAEYKRCGIPTGEILRGMLLFDPCFLIREMIRRKGSARRDGAACLAAAEKFGLKQTGGTKAFPFFAENQ